MGTSRREFLKAFGSAGLYIAAGPSVDWVQPEILRPEEALTKPDDIVLDLNKAASWRIEGDMYEQPIYGTSRQTLRRFQGRYIEAEFMTPYNIPSGLLDWVWSRQETQEPLRVVWANKYQALVRGTAINVADIRACVENTSMAMYQDQVSITVSLREVCTREAG